MGAGQQHRLARLRERRARGHHLCVPGAARVVAVDDAGALADGLLVDAVVGGVHDEPAGRTAEALRGKGPQRGVRRDPEREAVVHRRGVGQHQPLALVAVQRHRGTPVGEVEGQPLPELVPRPRRAQVEERLERQVDRLDLPRVVLAPGEQSADLAGQDTAASVVLDGELPLAYAEQGRGLRVHHLLDSLDLHEVVARADRAEPEPRKLHRESGELVPQAVHAAVPPEVEPAALLDTLEVVGGCAPALHAELGAVLGRLEHLAGAQLLVALRRVGVALAHAPHEALDRPRVRVVRVQRDQRHPAVDRRAGQVGPDRAAGGDGHAGGQLHLRLVVEVRQHDRRSGEVGVGHP